MYNRTRYAEQLRREHRQFVAAGITGLLGALFGIFLLVTARCGDDHEDGYSVGTLINVRNEGALFPRPAAALLHTGEMKGDEYAMEPGHFEEARKLADRSARVRIEYSSRYACWAWNYSSCRFITKIEEAPAEVPSGKAEIAVPR